MSAKTKKNQQKKAPMKKIVLEGKFNTPMMSGSGSFQYSKMAAPISYGIRAKVRPPVTKSVAGGEIMTGSSLIMEVPTQNSAVSFSIQPGLSAIFPQIAPTAHLFSKYRFRSLRFKYVPRCGTGDSGQVTLAYNPDCLAIPPTNFTEATAYEGTAFGPVWMDGTCVDVRDHELRYIRTGAAPPNTDLKTYDCGTLTILIDDLSTDGPSKGFIIADYEIEFSSRVLIPPSGCEIQREYNQTSTSDTRLFLKASLLNAAIINPIVERVDISVGDVHGPVALGFPAGTWLVQWTYRTNESSPPSSYYPYLFTAPTSGVVYQVPDSQWTSSGTLSSGVTCATYLLYNPISASGDPIISSDGWFQATPQDDGAIINHSLSITGMICRFPGSQPYTPIIPGYNASPLAFPSSIDTPRHFKVSVRGQRQRKPEVEVKSKKGKASNLALLISGLSPEIRSEIHRCLPKAWHGSVNTSAFIAGSVKDIDCALSAAVLVYGVESKRMVMAGIPVDIIRSYLLA